MIGCGWWKCHTFEFLGCCQPCANVETFLFESNSQKYFHSLGIYIGLVTISHKDQNYLQVNLLAKLDMKQFYLQYTCKITCK